MKLILGAPVRICVLSRTDKRPRGHDVGRKCWTDEAWSNAAEMAWGAVPKGERATVSIAQAGRVSYWDVKMQHGVRSATNITKKVRAMRALGSVRRPRTRS